MTKIISQAYKLNKMLTLPENSELYFTDNSDISSWATEYVKSAVYLGIIQGMDDGSFKPAKNATRAEAAVCIIRLLNILQRQ